MGKGDQRSRKGKIISGSFGNSRMRVAKLEKKEAPAAQAAPAAAAEKPAAKPKAAAAPAAKKKAAK